MSIWQLLLGIFTYASGNAEKKDEPKDEPLEEGSFFEDDDEDDEDDAIDDDEDGDEDTDDNTDDDADDEDESEEDEDSEDSDDEDGESTDDDSESGGKGADEEEDPQVDSAALALKTAVKSRLLAEAKDTSTEAPEVALATVEEMQAAFPDMNVDDVKAITGLVNEGNKKAMGDLYKKVIHPMIQQTEAANRKLRLQSALSSFNQQYPTALQSKKVSDAIMERYNEFVAEFGTTLAESVTLEEYYLMTGAKGKKAAATAAEDTLKKVAKDQKKKAKKATTKPGSVGSVRSGRRRKPNKDKDLLALTFDHIRTKRIDPFTIR